MTSLQESFWSCGWLTEIKSVCELRSLEVHNCNKLLNVFSSNSVKSLQNLEELDLSYCDSLEVVYDFEGMNIEQGHVALAALKNLKLTFLPKLTHLWKKAPPGIQGLQNLRWLEVDYCWSLKYIFTPSIAKLLVKLEKLCIKDCAIVEIVGEDQEGSEENEEATKVIMFSQLNHLCLENLPDLMSFGPKPYTFEWPSLKELSLKNANTKVFIPAFLGAQKQWTIKARSSEQVREQQITFPSLEVLELGDEDTVEWNMDEILFPQLRCLTLEGLKNLASFFPKTNTMDSNFLKTKNLKTSGEFLPKDLHTHIQHLFSEKVAFPSLEELYLINLNNLNEIWCSLLPNSVMQICKMDHKGTMGFQNLKRLKVRGCGSLRSIFNPSMARSLVHLEKLVIEYCEMVEEIVVREENEQKDRTDKIVIPHLNSLEFSHLPNLTSFCQGLYAFDLPSLEDMTVHDCPKMKTFSFGFLSTPKLDKVKDGLYPLFWMGDLNNSIQVSARKVTGTEILELSLNDNVECIMHSQVPVESFCEVRTIRVRECNKLLNIVPSNLLQSFGNLEEIIVDACASLVELFEGGLNVEDRDIVLLPKLKRVHLQNLPEFKHIWKREHESILFFQSLSVLRVRFCNSLQNLFSPSMAKSAEQLQELELSYCEMMTEIVAKEDKGGDEKSMDKIKFPQLRRLTLEGLPKLVSFFTKANLNSFNVGSGEIYPQVDLHTHIQHLFNEKVAFPSLEELTLFCMYGLNEIWCKKDRKGTMGFQNLKSLEVKGCDNLKNLFYPSMAGGFIHLEKLFIENCEMMEEIVVKEENEEEEEDRMDKIMIPQLKSLELSLLSNLTSFCQGLYAFDLPSLEDVTVRDCPKLKTFSFGFPSTPKLEGVKEGYGHLLWMGDLNYTIQVSARKFSSAGIKVLELLHNDNVERIVYSQLPAGSLSEIRKMCVGQCNKLLNVVPSDLLQSFGNLEEITVDACASLVEVFEVEGLALNAEERDIVLLSQLKELHLQKLPELKHIWKRESKGILFFQSLSVLRVQNCNSLRNILSTSMAKSAEKLQELKISYCKIMTEIVAEEDKGEGDEKAMENIEFPQLQRLTLRGLPNLVSFFPKVNTKDYNFPRAETLNAIDVGSGEILSKVNLLSQSQHLFNEKVVFPSLEKLELSYMKNLNELWCSELPNFMKETMCFQNLKSLTIKVCGQLRNLFYPSVARGLLNLEELIIAGCKMMEEIVVKEENEEEDRLDKVVIPRLKTLGLGHLPNLTSFCQGPNAFDLPSLKVVLVCDCPEMRIFSLGLLSTPNLEEVFEGPNKSSCWMGDLNSTIQSLFARKDQDDDDYDDNDNDDDDDNHDDDDDNDDDDEDEDDYDDDHET